MELWDVYDEERRLTGRTMVRGEAYPEDGYHLVVHMCVFNSRGEMLLQRRQRIGRIVRLCVSAPSGPRSSCSTVCVSPTPFAPNVTEVS